MAGSLRTGIAAIQAMRHGAMRQCGQCRCGGASQVYLRPTVRVPGLHETPHGHGRPLGTSPERYANRLYISLCCPCICLESSVPISCGLIQARNSTRSGMKSRMTLF